MGRLGFYVVAIDLRYGAEHDITRVELRRQIIGWVQARWVIATPAGFPCTSFSRARNMPGGPPALRTSDYITGLPELRPADQAKVAMGNLLLRWVVNLARARQAVGTILILENPWTLWAWKMPTMAALIHNKAISFTRTDYCCLGTPWRKTTGFVTASMPMHGFARTCRGQKACDITKKPHTVLKGQSPRGVFWTLIAEPYPELMCRALARLTCNGVQEKRAVPLARILDR